MSDRAKGSRPRVWAWDAMSHIAERRAITIVRATDREVGLARCRRLIEAGADVIEISFTTPDAAALIAELVAAAGSTALIGAGTVLDAPTAHAAIDAGAQFLLAPGLAPEMLRTGQRAGIAVIPAAQTATEAIVAMESGASAVKLFPAATVGVAGMRALAEALPQVPFIPTGGIELASARAWIDAGAIAVGLGGATARAEPSDLHQILVALATSGDDGDDEVGRSWPMAR